MFSSAAQKVYLKSESSVTSKIKQHWHSKGKMQAGMAVSSHLAFNISPVFEGPDSASEQGILYSTYPAYGKSYRQQ